MLTIPRAISWTWEKNGKSPADFVDGAGMYEGASKQVRALLGDQFFELTSDESNPNGRTIPVYVRVIKK